MGGNPRAVAAGIAIKRPPIMNASLVDQVVNSVLYEGYILYPYRASSIKNRTRFTFGRVYPEAFSISQHGAEPFIMQTECLVQSTGAPLVEVSVRFLHPLAREIGALEPDRQPSIRAMRIRSPCRSCVLTAVFIRHGRKRLSEPSPCLRSRSRAFARAFAGAAVYVSVFVHKRTDLR